MILLISRLITPQSFFCFFRFISNLISDILFKTTNNWSIFRGCSCLKDILCKNGFDSPEYLDGLTEEQLDSFEESISQNRRNFGDVSVKCEHLDFYNNESQKFKFLPGHRIFLLNFSKSIQSFSSTPSSNQSFEHPAFPILLRDMINTALNNHGKSVQNNRYPELLMDFAIYIYIMAGKACYEVISANLPLPSAVTIGNSPITAIFFIYIYQ